MKISVYINEKRLNRNEQDAIAEYRKRLGSYCKTDLFLKFMQENSLNNFLSRFHKEDTQLYFVNYGSGTLSSEDFADVINRHGLNGCSHLVFMIGYSLPTEIHPYTGLPITTLTLSNGLCSVVLFEQIYRAYRILNNQPYHK